MIDEQHEHFGKDITHTGHCEVHGEVLGLFEAPKSKWSCPKDNCGCVLRIEDCRYPDGRSPLVWVGPNPLDGSSTPDES